MFTQQDIEIIKKSALELLRAADDIEVQQKANLRMKSDLEKQIEKIIEQNKNNVEALDLATHAIEILKSVSDKAVYKAYRRLENQLNSALERMFTHTTRKIALHEYMRGNYPQLEVILTVSNGKKRSLKTDSGHGLAQIISLLCVLSLIVVTNSRRILVMDEILSGLSIHNRMIVTDILWAFTDIGFQFIVNEHGYIPKGSKVYHLEMVGDVSRVKESYIEEKGVYLNNSDAQIGG